MINNAVSSASWVQRVVSVVIGQYERWPNVFLNIVAPGLCLTIIVGVVVGDIPWSLVLWLLGGWTLAMCAVAVTVLMAVHVKPRKEPKTLLNAAWSSSVKLATTLIMVAVGAVIGILSANYVDIYVAERPLTSSGHDWTANAERSWNTFFGAWAFAIGLISLFVMVLIIYFAAVSVYASLRLGRQGRIRAQTVPKSTMSWSRLSNTGRVFRLIQIWCIQASRPYVLAVSGLIAAVSAFFLIP